MLGQRHVHRSITYFFSDVFDLTFNAVGDMEDADEQVLRGSTDAKSFSVLRLKDNRLRGAVLLGRPLNEERAVGTLILNRIDLRKPPCPLNDERCPLEQAANQTVLILQGGGAMGAFECGVIKALEENGIFPDVVAGVSIGAFNAAIVAAHPRRAAPALEAFWRDLAFDSLGAPTEELRRAFASVHALFWGSPRFFLPRWMTAMLHPEQLLSPWTSFCDPAPVLDLLRRYVDFDTIEQSPVRLLTSAVDVETAQQQIFDSYIDDLTPEHILASGSLPPGFPWTSIGGRHYWDGGLLSNSPLELVIEHTSLSRKNIYVVNLYPGANRLPRNISEVLSRRDEILYCEKMAGTLRTRDTIETFRSLVDEIMAELPPGTADQIRQRPEYIETMGEASSVSITRIEHRSEPDDLASRDYDFSRESIERLIGLGYEAAQTAIARQAAGERKSKRRGQ
jgi:predicted acylesterase/phospholipase RssA